MLLRSLSKAHEFELREQSSQPSDFQLELPLPSKKNYSRTKSKSRKKLETVIAKVLRRIHTTEFGGDGAKNKQQLKKKKCISLQIFIFFSKLTERDLQKKWKKQRSESINLAVECDSVAQS